MHWTSIMDFNLPSSSDSSRVANWFKSSVCTYLSIYYIQHAIRETLYLDCWQVYSSHPEIWVNYLSNVRTTTHFMEPIKGRIAPLYYICNLKSNIQTLNTCTVTVSWLLSAYKTRVTVVIVYL